MKKESGFTLIETLIYVALFLIIIGGSLVAAYQIISSASSLQTKVVVSEEANFMLRKIDWALTNATAIASPGSPGVAGNGTTLAVTKGDLPGAQNPVTISFSGSNIQLKRGSNTPDVLNSNNVVVSGGMFTHTVSSGIESIQASFTIAGQTFQTTKYIRD